VEVLTAGLDILRRWWPTIGTYALVEVVLPGGTLLALLLYLYRRRRLADLRR
jgi:hypothetical protein